MVCISLPTKNQARFPNTSFTIMLGLTIDGHVGVVGLKRKHLNSDRRSI